MSYNYIVKFFITLISIYPLSSNSQTYEIQYEEFFKAIHGDFKKVDHKDEDLTVQKTGFKTKLMYSNGVSLYQHITQQGENVDKEKSSDGEIFVGTVSQPSTYKNQNNNQLTVKKENYMPAVYGEDILIKDVLPSYKWDISNTTIHAAGYTCRMAKTTNVTGDLIQVWFTEEIPINDGPRDYWGLPGLIVKVQINEAVLVIAKSIKKLDKELKIQPPAGGNKMTSKEFRALYKKLTTPGMLKLPDGREVWIH